MSSLVVSIVSLILINQPTTTHSQAASKGIGISACSYNGEVDPAYKCTYDPFVPVEKLPDQCTAFIYDVFLIDTENSIMDVFDRSKSLTQLLKNGNDVHVMYGHYGQVEWNDALGCNDIALGKANADSEMKILKEYLAPYQGIKGIILTNLLSSVEPKIVPVNENLKAYIEIMKTNFPGIAVGISIGGIDLDGFTNSPDKATVDFTVVDSVVDYYVLDYIGFQQCTADLRDTGNIPITGDAKLTLEKQLAQLQMIKVPTNKLYYYYDLGATTLLQGGSMCELSSTMVCTDPEGSDWCADTQQSYRNKGKFAKDNGAGFIARNVDLNDANGCCQCGFPYPAFKFLLDGFNGITTPTPCPLFDRK